MRVLSISILGASLSTGVLVTPASADPSSRRPESRGRDIPVRYMDFVVPELGYSQPVGTTSPDSYRAILDRHTLKAMEIQDSLHGEGR